MLYKEALHIPKQPKGPVTLVREVAAPPFEGILGIAACAVVVFVVISVFWIVADFAIVAFVVVAGLFVVVAFVVVTFVVVTFVVVASVVVQGKHS